jgi:hypothetical protein
MESMGGLVTWVEHLLEVVVQALALVGEDGHRGVGSHGAGRLLACSAMVKRSVSAYLPSVAEGALHEEDLVSRRERGSRAAGTGGSASMTATFFLTQSA